MKSTFFITLLFSLFAFTTFAQTSLLRQQIAQIIATKNATVGVAIDAYESGDTLSINNNVHYPMQSVFKFHIAWRY